MCYVIAFFILLSQISIIWTISVYRLFHIGTGDETEISVWGVGTNLADIVFQFYVYRHYNYFKENKVNMVVKAFWKHFFIILYLVTFPSYNRDFSQSLLAIDFIIVILIAFRIE